MPFRSSSPLAVALCGATVIALGPGITASAPQLGPPLLQAEPAFDLSAVVGVGSCANALNELGTVVGIRREFGIVRGFSWSTDGGLVDLEPDTNALAVNDHGEVAGQANVTGSGLGARVWTSAGMREIAYGIAYSLNNRTEVVGFHLPPVGDPPIIHGFLWTAADGLRDVESLAGVTPPWSYLAPLSMTRFIRSDGVMVGERGGRAVRWQPDGLLSTFGDGVANGLNDRDEAAGATGLSNGYPVVWRGGSQTVLADAIGEATAINAAGYVVGWMTIAGERHGFVWHAEHGLQDLGSGQGRDIDEIGNIAGCRGSGDASRATVWQVAMTDGEHLVGFDALARRLLADVDDKASRRVFREITLARKALDQAHGRTAARHLDRALEEIADLARSGALPPEWAAALERVGQELAGRL